MESEEPDYINSLNARVNKIYNVLCEHEQELNERCKDTDPIKLFELLETIDEMHAAVQELHPVNELLTTRTNRIRQQMELLQNSMELLQLERKIKSVELDD